MHTYLVYSCVVVCLMGLLSPLAANGQGLGGLGGLLQDKNKSKKGGGVAGFGETLGMLFEDSATTLGIATQESWLKSYSSEGLQHEQNGDWNEAIASYKQAIEVLENLRGEFKESGDKESLVEQYLWVYARLVKLSLRLSAPEDAFAYAERSKARSFLDQLAEARAGIRKGVDPDLLAEEQQYHRQLNDAWKTLGEKAAAYDASISPPERTALQQELEALQRRIEELEQGLKRLQRTMRNRNPRYAELKYPQPISLNEVQKTLLQKGETLLEYFWGEHELFLFVVKRDSFQALTLPVKEQEIARHVETLRGRIKNIVYARQDVNLTLKLYQQLVQPTEPYLQGTNTLLIVPDGALHYLPFDLFVTPAPDASANEEVEFSEYHDLNYLIRRYATVYAPSVSVLKPDILYHAQDAGQPAHTFLALAPFTEEQLAQNAPVVEALRTLSIVEDKQSARTLSYVICHFPRMK